MYDADAAREALDEAKRFEKSGGTDEEKAESWTLAAERFEEGLTLDRFAASQSIHCWRKARNLEKAGECAETALEYFGGDPWVRSNAAWVQYDKLKSIGRNLDEAMPALKQMLELMRGLNDVGILSDSAFFRIRALTPLRDVAPADVLDFLAERFEQLFDGCTSLSRDGKPSPKEQLAQLAADHFEAQERWDDAVAAMQRVVQAFPREARYARLYVRALLEMHEPERALAAADDALIEVGDAELVRWKARALASLGRLEDACTTLISGCYRFPDLWLWRDLAKIRFQRGDLEGSNRALAVALRQLEKRSVKEKRELKPRLHQGRSAGFARLGEAELAAKEAAAARLAYQDARAEPPEELARIVEQIATLDAQALDRADDLAEAGTLEQTLNERYATEREAEIEAGLSPAEVVFLDTEKGFGYLQPEAAEAGEPEELPRVYVAVTSLPSEVNVGDKVRMFATPVTNAESKNFGAKQRAVVVRPATAAEEA